jgi:hypothetical protein
VGVYKGRELSASTALFVKSEPEVGKGYRHQATGFRRSYLKPLA